MEIQQRGRLLVVAFSALFFVVVGPLVGGAIPILLWLVIGVLGSAGGLISPFFDNSSQFFRYLGTAYVVVAPTAIFVGAIFGWMLNLGNEATDRRRRGWALVLSSVILSPLLAYVAAQTDQVDLPVVVVVAFAVLGPIVFGVTGKIFIAAFDSGNASARKTRRDDA